MNKNELKIRLAAFNWLSKQVELYESVLPRSILEKGFEYEDQRIPLISPQGIFKPKIMNLPLTITTAPEGPYQDRFDKNNLLLYRYRGTDPKHRDNVGLRTAMQKQVPLIYLFGLMPGKYMPVWPVFIVDDDPDNLTFRVAVEEFDQIENLYQYQSEKLFVADTNRDIRRQYLTAQTKHRVHQEKFRKLVLSAYQNQCSFCHLRHRELLDAAHIISDKEPEGEPIVNNGIALCKIHHAAFDKFFLAIRPDYVLEVRKDVQKEEDGPMLLHGLQGLHGKRIILPRAHNQWPDQTLLEKKYEYFKNAGK